MKNKRRLWISMIVILLFVLLLIGARLFWMKAFNHTKEIHITNGQLDLRDLDFADEPPVTLSGEWEFQPSVLLQESLSENANRDLQYVNVPGDWSDALNPEDQSPYGYGTYHLRILVDTDKDTSFSMRIPSVRSASALYANGMLIGESGEVGKSLADSKAMNAPYSSNSIRADESGAIDITLQVSNFEDPRPSGFVRAVEFGEEERVKKETQLSTMLQVITAAIFMLHAIFAVIIFLVGIRDKRLLYFALAITILSIINLMGGDEKVLLQYIPLGYQVSYKMSMITLFSLSWSLLHCVGPQVKQISKKILPTYTVLFVIALIITIILPLDSLTRASNFTFGSVFVAAIIAIIALIRSRKSVQGGIWIALSIVAMASHYSWWAYTMATGAKFVYYPFDLVIAIICLAGVWFKHYHQINLATEEQALRLQQADKEKDEFLANTSHELRNPLHSILNISQGVLERDGASLQEKSVRNLDTALAVGRRMSFMLDELLEMAQLKDGKPTMDVQPVSLQAITVGVMDMVQFMIEGKPIQMKNHIPDNFPPVMADENRVIQIMFNLLHNAVKFTSSGEIILDASLQGKNAVISVKDTGKGMDRETVKSIFKAYTQGDHGNTVGGFGLGLHISKKLIELHGSTLGVESVLGEGSSFTFNLPLADIATNTDTVEKEVAATEITHPIKDDISSLGAKKRIEVERDFPRIIVVDDDPVNLEVMETILSTTQYEITSVISAKDAISLLDEKEWDLVISDVMMPQMSGYELTRIIRNRFTMSELPVLLLTARNRPEDLENGFLAGANDYITKPVEARELRSRVQALTEVRQSMRERLNMEIAWLQAQIQPHFLFNTLNSILALSEIDIKRMQELLTEFSHVLRGKYDFENEDGFVPIDQELSLIRSYLYIEKVRFGDRLSVQWEIDEDIDLIIPALSIQPLIENAVNHGIMKQMQGGTITIRVEECHNDVEITIIDDGVGIEPHVLKRIMAQKRVSESGVGLVNTSLRLQRLYGKGLQISSVPGKGTTISFIIPY